MKLTILDIIFYPVYVVMKRALSSLTTYILLWSMYSVIICVIMSLAVWYNTGLLLWLICFIYGYQLTGCVMYTKYNTRLMKYEHEQQEIINRLKYPASNTPSYIRID